MLAGKMMPRAARVAVGFALLALALPGCGSKGEVSGKVTYNNKPLTGGRVTFIGEKGTFPVDIKEDGTYTATDVPTGTYKVTVETFTAGAGVGAMPKAPHGVGAMKPPEGGGESGGMGPPNMGKQVPIPGKYKEADKSGLSTTVKKGKQEYDIPLTP